MTGQADTQNHLSLGRSYRENRQYDSAVAELRKGLESDSRNPELHLELGRALREKMDFAQSVKELAMAAELNPASSEIYLELGRAYREKGDVSLAEDALNAALARNKGDGRVYLELGRLSLKNDDPESGIRHLRCALENGLDNYETRLELARALRQKKDYGRAIAEFESALRHDPSDARTHLELGWVYYDNADYESAAREVKESIDLGCGGQEAHISLGRMYRKIGKYELSVDEFEKALKMSPDKDDAFYRNKMLNEIEISQRKTVLESKPIGLGITLTTRCNLKCSICGIWKERWDISEKTVRETINLLPYLERVVWQGGEVFLSEYFEALFENASSYPNLKQTIITNGLLIDERWAAKLARKNVCLTYSIDAVTQDEYEKITSGAKFEDLLKSINLVNKYRFEHGCRGDFHDKMTTILNVVTMGSNYRQLEAIIDFAGEFNFDEVQLVPLLGISGQENIFSNQDKGAAGLLPGILKRAAKKSKDYGIILHNWLPPIEMPGVGPAAHQGLKDEPNEPAPPAKDDRKGIECYLPWQQMFMTPDHRLKPGCHCILDAGDVDKDSLEEIWNGRAMQSYRKGLLSNDYGGLCGQACISGAIPSKELKVSRYY